MNELIRAEQINKHYDGTWALKNASFSVMPGEVHALMGENGAGKSTLSKIFAGAVRPDSGSLHWQGEPVTIDSPIAAQRLGIGMVFQELDLFPHLSIAENIVIGNVQKERSKWVKWRGLVDFCRPFLDQVGLHVDPRTLAGDLRLPEMQLVAIARALSFEARLIILDEPTSALSDDAVDRLFALIRRLKTTGVSFVYVSHKMKEVLTISDRITVLRDGETIGTRSAPDTTIDEIITMMVGRELAQTENIRASAAGEVVLRAANLTTRHIREVSFEVRKGEVLGVAGLAGAGRSELGAALFGLDRITSGTVWLNGSEFRPRSPRDANRLGLGLVPEDRKTQGLMMQMSVLENSTMAALPRFQHFGFVTPGAEARASKPIHRDIALKAASNEISVRSLSGGNQQKVLLSRWLLADPDVLFLDDPARGIDIGAKRDIYRIIQELSARGKAVLFVSSELPELLQCCHRILVMREGRCAGIIDAAAATQESIMQLAAVDAGR